MMFTLLQVAIGGDAGASFRYLVTISSTNVFGVSFPFGTLIVNVVGSFLMGMIITYFLHDNVLEKKFAPLLVTGFLGGFTTFSAFSNDTWQLYSQGKIEGAIIYIILSILLSLVALLAGIFIVKV